MLIEFPDQHLINQKGQNNQRPQYLHVADTIPKVYLIYVSIRRLYKKSSPTDN